MAKVVSKRNSLCKHDAIDWLQTTALFAAPLLLIALEEYSRSGDVESAVKMVMAALLQAAIGLLRKFVKSSVYEAD